MNVQYAKSRSSRSYFYSRYFNADDGYLVK